MNILVIGQCTLHWGRMEFGNNRAASMPNHDDSNNPIEKLCVAL